VTVRTFQSTKSGNNKPNFFWIVYELNHNKMLFYFALAHYCNLRRSQYSFRDFYGYIDRENFLLERHDKDDFS
jgi:hypothetical protein